MGRGSPTPRRRKRDSFKSRSFAGCRSGNVSVSLDQFEGELPNGVLKSHVWDDRLITIAFDPKFGTPIFY
jgi:hypothetical protein